MAETILIVEDEASLAALLDDVLRAAGYNVVLTTSLRAAERANELRPAAIVMDYVMPGLNGAQVAERIREVMREATPPLVLVTGLPNARDLAENMGAGAFLRKPFDVDAFVDAIRRLIGQQSQ